MLVRQLFAHDIFAVYLIQELQDSLEDRIQFVGVVVVKEGY